ncbi:GntR family transcriptional regulator [Leeia sp. TBRC 13508]|uniref:GntR family transcriptional regulator n=1 Tax=Leeia speluncae TaxID=2884804 RepID=A0ABS8DAS9_9NEIS|nr:GntR family transcriptional regulator [Leeia speluncae]MCB6185305.1 GntR family transcriptional regulator [Leeia speluncae]
MKKNSPIARQTLTGAVTEALRNRILSGELPDGSQLRQEALSLEFGVSRVPVREALRQLEAEGLIQIFDHKGAIVTKFSLDDIKELLDIRVMVEGDLIERAANHAESTAFNEAENILNQFADALAQQDISLWGRLNAHFHLALYKPANRPHSLALVESLLNKTERYTRMQILYAKFDQQATDEHRHLIDFCKAGEGKKAREYLSEHILKAEKALEDFFAQRQHSER